nr:hypothetical protein OG781_15275 [Streptomyces sp. NBC_00830]
METWTQEHDLLAKDLERIISSQLLDPVDILFGLDEPLRERAVAETRDWATTLLGTDDRAAQYTAIRLVSVLYPSDAPFDPPAEWWSTPFGRAVALRAGHPAAEAVPFSVAAAMLGITRQGVHDLTNRGKLERHPSGGVTVASVRTRITTRAAGSHTR